MINGITINIFILVRLLGNIRDNRGRSIDYICMRVCVFFFEYFHSSCYPGAHCGTLVSHKHIAYDLGTCINSGSVCYESENAINELDILLFYSNLIVSIIIFFF